MTPLRSCCSCCYCSTSAFGLLLETSTATLLSLSKIVTLPQALQPCCAYMPGCMSSALVRLLLLLNLWLWLAAWHKDCNVAAIEQNGVHLRHPQMLLQAWCKFIPYIVLPGCSMPGAIEIVSRCCVTLRCSSGLVHLLLLLNLCLWLAAWYKDCDVVAIEQDCVHVRHSQALWPLLVLLYVLQHHVDKDVKASQCPHLHISFHESQQQMRKPAPLFLSPQGHLNHSLMLWTFLYP